MVQNKTQQELAQKIEHTNVKPDATAKDIEILCKEALEYGFYAVCVNGCYVRLAKFFLKGFDTKVVQTLGFPFGASENKWCEIQEEADELDVVISVGHLKSGNYDYVIKDIESVVENSGGRTVKVIMSMPFLTASEATRGIKIAKYAGADIIKTCTGFEGRGVNEDDIRLIVEATDLPVKASGGIRSYEKVRKLLALGVSRFGTSSGVSILKEANNV